MFHLRSVWNKFLWEKLIVIVITSLWKFAFRSKIKFKIESFKRNYRKVVARYLLDLVNIFWASRPIQIMKSKPINCSKTRRLWVFGSTEPFLTLASFHNFSMITKKCFFSGVRSDFCTDRNATSIKNLK